VKTKTSPTVQEDEKPVLGGKKRVREVEAGRG